MKQPEKKREPGKRGHGHTTASPAKSRGAKDRPVRQESHETDHSKGKKPRPDASSGNAVSSSGKIWPARSHKPETKGSTNTRQRRESSQYKLEQNTRTRRPNPAARAIHPEIHEAQTQFARAQASMEAEANAGRVDADRASRPTAHHTGRAEGAHVRQPIVPANLGSYVDILIDAIETAVPLPASHRKDLKFAIRDLSRELTSERTERRRDYLGMPANHSAYLRYFLPWNVLRISQIAANLELKLSDGDSILDIGSGPWTLPIAFWIGRPELRNVKLRWILGDRVKKPLDSGKAIFDAFIKLVHEKSAKEPTSSALSGSTDACPWEFSCVREQFPGLAAQKREKPFALITAANVLNELFWDERVHLDLRARKILETLAGNAARGARLLIIEPGEPRSGTMISALREGLLVNRGRILAPCTHTNACPMPGSYLGAAMRASKTGSPIPEGAPELVNMPASRTKYPWCHFVLNTAPAPKRLLMLSELAGIPKDRLVASWLYAELPQKQAKAQKSGKGYIRLVSDKIVADGKAYRYACGEAGYIMAGPPFSQYPSGTVIGLEDAKSRIPGTLDRKTHALLLE